LGRKLKRRIYNIGLCCIWQNRYERDVKTLYQIIGIGFNNTNAAELRENEGNEGS